jgi:hypothetical protein
LHREPLASTPSRLDFQVDILKLFKGSTNIDMGALPSVKFDRIDAALLARNFTSLVTMMRSDAAGRPDRAR